MQFSISQIFVAEATGLRRLKVVEIFTPLPVLPTFAVQNQYFSHLGMLIKFPAELLVRSRRALLPRCSTARRSHSGNTEAHSGGLLQFANASRYPSEELQ